MPSQQQRVVGILTSSLITLAKDYRHVLRRRLLLCHLTPAPSTRANTSEFHAGVGVFEPTIVYQQNLRQRQQHQHHIFQLATRLGKGLAKGAGQCCSVQSALQQHCKLVYVSKFGLTGSSIGIGQHLTVNVSAYARASATQIYRCGHLGMVAEKGAGQGYNTYKVAMWLNAAVALSRSLCRNHTQMSTTIYLCSTSVGGSIHSISLRTSGNGCDKGSGPRLHLQLQATAFNRRYSHIAPPYEST